MTLPPQFLDELRARVPVSEVVGQRVRLARAGARGEYKGLCPFHKEKTPSFTVSDDKGFYYCFGCGAKGDVVSFLVDHDRLAFMEAVEHLAARAGLQVPSAGPEEVARAERQRGLHDLVEAAARYFEHQLARGIGAEARAYLDGRGVGRTARERFRLGYAPADGRDLLGHLAQLGFAEEMTVEAGLARKPEDGRARFPFFRDRLIFPVADRRGRIVGFGGRILAGDGPKYINTPETPIFQKGRMLYGLDLARMAAGQGHPVIVVEGYMDVIALAEAGFGAAVAPLGTALTEDQVRAAWRLAPEPVLCFDGDEAGRRAAQRAAERVLPILKPDHTVRVAFLPAGEDPDSLVRGAGAAALGRLLQEARPLSRVVWEARLGAHAVETPEGRAGLLAGLMSDAGRIADAGVQQAYREEFRALFDRSYGPAVRRAASGRGFPGRRGPIPAPIPAGPRPGRPRRGLDAKLAASILLAAIVERPELFDELGEELGSLPMPDPVLADLAHAVITALGDHPEGESGLDSETLRLQLIEAGQSAALAELSRRRSGLGVPFLSPGTEAEAMRRGCREVLLRLAADRVGEELRVAERSLMEEPTEAGRLRVDGLRLEARRIAAALGIEAEDEERARIGA